MYQTFKKVILVLLKLLQKTENEEILLKLVRPTYLDTKDNMRKTRGQLPYMIMDANIFSTVIASQIQQLIERILHYDQVGFIQKTLNKTPKSCYLY